MQDMIQPKTLTTVLFHVCLEGIYAYYQHVTSITCTCHYTCSTKKIVGISTIARKEHSTAQTREIACTKEVLANVISRGMY